MKGSKTGAVSQAKRKGWFVIPGVQDGDRTLEEQSVALRPALEACAGKHVLDMGCAEGLVAHEFAVRGAASVTGWDVVKDHIYVARKHFDHPNTAFRVLDLNDHVHKRPTEPKYDIVLALGIIHKLWHVETGLRFAAANSSDLLLLRSGVRCNGGVITSKHNVTAPPVDAKRVLESEGFVLECTMAGGPKHHEDVDYWRRKR